MMKVFILSAYNKKLLRKSISKRRQNCKFENTYLTYAGNNKSLFDHQFVNCQSLCIPDPEQINSLWNIINIQVDDLII